MVAGQVHGLIGGNAMWILLAVVIESRSYRPVVDPHGGLTAWAFWGTVYSDLERSKSLHRSKENGTSC
jgi:hypothetical protein